MAIPQGGGSLAARGDTDAQEPAQPEETQPRPSALQRCRASIAKVLKSIRSRFDFTLSKSSRIILLLAIDSVFFLLELVTGYTVHSLALVADSFHMLNDVLSLCVGLWAVRVASQKATRHQLKTYTYGWQRAETLGALVNGVFLVALCVTIFLDAIQRFVEPQEVSQPMLVLIVGCLGLFSNIVGLVLFHDHSHSHGSGGHSHGANDAISEAEEGHAHTYETPEGEAGHEHPHSPLARAGTLHTEGSESTAVDDGSTLFAKPPISGKKRSGSQAHGRSHSGLESIHVNPNAFRRSIIDASNTQLDSSNFEEGVQEEGEIGDDDGAAEAVVEQPLLGGHKSRNYGGVGSRKSIDHQSHKHAQPKEAGKGHGHSHGDLNMRGIFLHVMGDALGNLGVIATALIIWLTDFSWRFYFDPAISLVITVIILCSAIPLCKAASRILLQAVPAGINIDDIQSDIENLPGIVSCHHLHVWQLNDTKLVASLHVQVGFDFKGEGSARYMDLAQAIRKCLHEYGIHSSTIQPEFCLDPDHDHSGGDVDDTEGGAGQANISRNRTAIQNGSKPGSIRDPSACLLECDCDDGNRCCEPVSKDPHNAHLHGK